MGVSEGLRARIDAASSPHPTGGTRLQSLAGFAGQTFATLPEAAAAAIELVVVGLEVDAAAVVRFDPVARRADLLAHAAPTEHPTSPPVFGSLPPATTAAIERGQTIPPLVVDDARASAGWIDHPLGFLVPASGRAAAVPIVCPDGGVFGALLAVADLPRSVDPEEPAFLTTLAGLVAGHACRAEIAEAGPGDGRYRTPIEEAPAGVHVQTPENADDAPRAREAWCRSLLENLPGVVVLCDVDGRITYATPTVDELLGVPPHAMIGHRYVDYIHPDDVGLSTERFASFAATPGLGERLEFRVRRADGGVRSVEVWGNNRLDDPDVRALILNVRDVTERKKAEAAHAAAERRYRTLVEQIPAVVYTAPIDPDALCTYVSPQIERILGFSPPEIATQREFLAPYVHPDDQAFVAARNEETDRDRTPFLIEYRARAADGRWVWLHEEASLVAGEGDAAPFWQGVIIDVSAHKAAEEARMRAERRYRAVVDNAPAITYTMRPDRLARFDYGFVSPQVERVLGYTPDEIVGHPGLVRSLIHPDDLPLLDAANAAGAGGDAPIVCDLRLRAKDGRWVWLRDESVLVRDEAGEPLFWQGIAIDVTKAKEAEAALRARDERFGALIRHSADVIAVVDTDGTLAFVSPALRRVLGYDEHEIARPAVALTPHPDDAATVAAAHAELIATPGLTRAVELRLLHRDGSWRWLDVVMTNLIDHPSVGGVVYNARDITERKRAEDALAAERDLLQTIIDTATDPIYVKDARQVYVRINRAQASVLGVNDPADAVGKTMFAFFSRDKAERYAADERRLIETGEPLVNHLEQLDVGGSRSWFLITELPLRDAAGEVVGLVGLSRDVTGLKRAEEELAEALAAQRRTNRELATLARAKSGFISILSHEFRTPLTSIQGFSELIRDASLEAREVREFAAEIHRSAARLARLIGDILDLDRMQAARLTLDRRPVDLNDLADEVASLLRPASPNHRFVLDLDSALPPVAGDADRLIQVLTNLLANAVRYAPDGGSVTVTTRPDGGWAKVSVADQGVGIPAEALKTIFEPYVRLRMRDGRRVAGSGLGLSITRELVELHGGRIWAESRHGGGSVFHLTLPLAAPPERSA